VAVLKQADLRNRLLKGIPPDEFEALRPALRAEAMPLRHVLIASHTVIETVHFPEEGFVSITTDGPSGRVEIGLIGREGLVGAAPILLDDDRSPHTHFAQMAGHMLSIDVAVLRAEVERRPALRGVLHRFIQAQFVQTAQTAFVNVRGNTAIRLARWLLMCHDRIDGDHVTVTQDFMSFMLGVERPGVTAALRVLAEGGFIRKHRGSVEIISRDGLLDLAGDSYGVAEAEYARLIEGRFEPNI
jgi:CRP-like cAMP-binding protein